MMYFLYTELFNSHTNPLEKVNIIFLDEQIVASEEQ